MSPEHQADFDARIVKRFRALYPNDWKFDEHGRKIKRKSDATVWLWLVALLAVGLLVMVAPQAAPFEVVVFLLTYAIVTRR